jgi:hypothetical protein
MSKYDSSNLQPPAFGPQFPIYPELPQLNRVTGPAIAGTGPAFGTLSIYPATTQQWQPPLSLRDRESAYVVEPNNFPLSPGVYDCRLVSSYNGLPLYATSCCITGSSSSASSSSSSAAAGIRRYSLGTATTGALIPALGLPVVVPVAGMLLIIAGATSTEAMIATYNGQTLPAGPFSTNLPAGLAVRTFYGQVAPGTGQVEVAFAGDNVAFWLIQAVLVTNVKSLDQQKTAFGTLTTPDTGATGTTAVSQEYAQGAFLMFSPGAFSWANGFTSGGQDVSQPQAANTYLSEGYRILSATSTVDAALSGTQPPNWCGLVGTWR